MNTARRLDPARLLFDLNRAAKIWFVLFLVAVAALLLSLILQFVPRHNTVERFLVIASDGVAYRAAPEAFAAITNLHVRVAEDASYAFLNRSPIDFDQPERVQLLFLPEALAKAREHFAYDLRERQAKQLHQKAEISRVQFARVGEEQVLVSVRGQLIQVGVFEGQIVADPVSFKLDLDLVRNPNLSLNASFPLVVRNFKYEIIRR